MDSKQILFWNQIPIIEKPTDSTSNFVIANSKQRDSTSKQSWNQIETLGIETL